MRVVPYSKTIMISTTFRKFSSFVSHTKNLLRWSKFFISLDKEENGNCTFRTKMGVAKTWIKTQTNNKAHVFTICSIMKKKKESASLVVRKKDTFLDVQFTVRLPRNLSHDAIERQLTIMDLELHSLKRILEKERNKHAAV